MLKIMYWSCYMFEHHMSHYIYDEVVHPHPFGLASPLVTLMHLRNILFVLIIQDLLDHLEEPPLDILVSYLLNVVL
jgi:hypothetical protein